MYAGKHDTRGNKYHCNTGTSTVDTAEEKFNMPSDNDHYQFYGGLY